MSSSPSTYALKPALATRIPATPRDAEAEANLCKQERKSAVPPATAPATATAQAVWPACQVVSQHANAWFFHDAAAISRFFSANKYTCFVQGGTEHIATESLTSLEARLSDSGFLRTHRSDLINLAHVTCVRRVQQSYVITLRDGQQVQASRRLVRILRERLGF